MVMAYRATLKDLLLMKPYRIYNGKKIDMRWSGGWLSPKGEYFPVDYRNGITHDTLAEEYGNQIWGSGSISSRPPIMRIFDIAGWMRITYYEGSSFCVNLKGTFVDHNRKLQLLNFVNDYRQGFESYFINDTKYKKYQDFVAAIRANKTGSSLKSVHSAQD